MSTYARQVHDAIKTEITGSVDLLYMPDEDVRVLNDSDSFENPMSAPVGKEVSVFIFPDSDPVLEEVRMGGLVRKEFHTVIVVALTNKIKQVLSILNMVLKEYQMFSCLT